MFTWFKMFDGTWHSYEFGQPYMRRWYKWRFEYRPMTLEESYIYYW